MTELSSYPGSYLISDRADLGRAKTDARVRSTSRSEERTLSIRRFLQ